MNKIKTFLINYLVSTGDSLSTLVNNALFFANDGNQSISGRCDDQKHDWFWGAFGHFIDWLAYTFFGQENHCHKAAVRDTMRGLGRAQKFVNHILEAENERA